MQGNPVYDGHLTDIDNAEDEPEIRNTLKLVTRDSRLKPGEIATLLDHGRARLALLKTSEIEHYSKEGLTIEPGKGGGGEAALSEGSTNPPHASTALAPQSSALLPAVTPEEIGDAVRRWNAIGAAIEKALGPQCIAMIHGNKFRRKIFWRAVRLAGKISLADLNPDAEVVKGADAVRRVHKTVQASAPDGSWVQGTAMCSSNEVVSKEKKLTREDNSDHQLAALAYTRAVNRAISDLVGFGEPSAEEVE